MDLSQEFKRRTEFLNKCCYSYPKLSQEEETIRFNQHQRFQLDKSTQTYDTSSLVRSVPDMITSLKARPYDFARLPSRSREERNFKVTFHTNSLDPNPRGSFIIPPDASTVINIDDDDNEEKKVIVCEPPAKTRAKKKTKRFDEAAHKIKCGRGGLHEKGTITVYAGGYHIVWRGNKLGLDSLHGPDGHHYGYFMPKSGKYDPTESEAFWKCTGSHRHVDPLTKRLIHKRCTWKLHELHGQFSPINPAKGHLPTPHLPSENAQIRCPVCIRQPRK